MKDEKGNIVEDGDSIKTSRGAVLKIESKDTELYAFHAKSQNPILLRNLKIGFTIIQKYQP